MRKRLINGIVVLGCLLAFEGPRAHAFTIVTVSTATTESTEVNLLNQIRSQFLAVISTNPLAANTYSVKLFGMNPDYNPPAIVRSLDQITTQLTAISTYTYVVGFADGMTYQQNQQIGFTGAMVNLCGGATNFMLVSSSSSTWDTGTCLDALNMIIDELFTLQLSTPVLIPGF